MYVMFLKSMVYRRNNFTQTLERNSLCMDRLYLNTGSKEQTPDKVT